MGMVLSIKVEGGAVVGLVHVLLKIVLGDRNGLNCSLKNYTEVDAWSWDSSFFGKC